MSAYARPLADRLSAASDADLSRLFRARGVRADVPWNDFFDAAEALLDPGSLARLLPLLNRDEAKALQLAAAGRDPGPTGDALKALALLRDDGSPFPSVLTAIGERPPVDDLPPVEPPPATEMLSAHAAERAFTTVGAVADILLQAREAPLTLLAAGGIGAAERRRLSETGIPGDDVDALIAIAVDAGLATAEDRLLRATSEAESWLHDGVGPRWVRLTSGFRDALPPGVRHEQGGWLPPAAWPMAHPWDADWAERSAQLARRAELLGLIAGDGSEPGWAAPLRRRGVVDAEPLTRLLPAEVDRIFLQNDLSAIAPGPLVPALDVRLRSIATRESAAQASSYRFTADSVAHAMVLGETEESILEFLETLSLTGIPQPLRYLISQSSQRHGLVRVSVDDETGRTRIESADLTLLEAMSVDQALRPLALTAHVGSLTTKVGRDSVYWALTDARYPATLVDDAGVALAAERHPVRTAAPSATPDYGPLIARLRDHQGPDADAAWLDRELEAAVRAKAVLRVTVGMPDGSTRELLLEATGLGGGRLRGRDRTADVERTLPVSSIRAAVVEP